MSTHQSHSPSDWKALIEEQSSSGLTGVAFCNERGLSAKTFYKQRQRLKRHNPASVEPRSGGFVQVHPSVSARSSGSLVLHYRDSRLELSAETPVSWVGELMKALT